MPGRRARSPAAHEAAFLASSGQTAAQDMTRGSIERFTRPLDEPAAGLFRADLDAHLQGRSFQFHHVLHFEQGGQTRALLARGVAVRQDGRPVRMAGSLTDISENERLQAQVAHEALHDRLTGLPESRVARRAWWRSGRTIRRPACRSASRWWAWTISARSTSATACWPAMPC